MGIPTLWEVLKPGLDERVSIDEFCARFLRRNGRPLRLAIDAYMFIFQSQAATTSGIVDGAAIVKRNFMSKILYLVALNISLVVVLDGRYKPSKLRHGITLPQGDEPNDYEKDCEAFRKLESWNDYTEFLPFDVKGWLEEYSIDYIQSPGEAEAQCAYLQRLSVVDYVLSNDVDTLVFGATQMLRNFSHFKQDFGTSPKKSIAAELTTSPKFFVTPVRIAKIEEVTGLNTSRLVFLATLGGGDYSKGVDKIGITNASRLALCGTKFAAYHDRKLTKKELKNPQERSPLPDFSQQLIECFSGNSSAHKSLGVWDSLLESSVRKRKLQQFLKSLNEHLKTNPRDIFGRLVTFDDQGLYFDEYYTLLYLFPFVNEHIYKFVPGKLSYAELKGPINEIELSNFNSSGNYTINRINSTGNDTYEIVGVSHIDFEINTEDFTPTIPEAESQNLYVPEEYSGAAKSIIVKLLSCTKFEHFDITDLLKITKSKVENNVDYLMVRYDPQEIGIFFPEITDLKKGEDQLERSRSHSPTRDNSPTKYSEGSDNVTKTKPDYIWLPREVADFVNPGIVKKFDEDVKKKLAKSSPKKSKYPAQKTTLDSFGSFSLSPAKQTDLSPQKSSTSSPRRRGSKSKDKVLPGQQSLDGFFQKKKEETNPFLDSASNNLFVGDESSDEEGQKATMFGRIKESFSTVPKLSPSNLSKSPAKSPQAKDLKSTVSKTGSPTKIPTVSKRKVIENNSAGQKEVSPTKKRSKIVESILSPIKLSFSKAKEEPESSTAVFIASQDDTIVDNSSIMEIPPPSTENTDFKTSFSYLDQLEKDLDEQSVPSSESDS